MLEAVFWRVSNTAAALAKLVMHLRQAGSGPVKFRYESEPCGYGVHRGQAVSDRDGADLEERDLAKATPDAGSHFGQGIGSRSIVRTGFGCSVWPTPGRLLRSRRSAARVGAGSGISGVHVLLQVRNGVITRWDRLRRKIC